jgi:hypothetical protein
MATAWLQWFSAVELDPPPTSWLQWFFAEPEPPAPEWPEWAQIVAQILVASLVIVVIAKVNSSGKAAAVTGEKDAARAMESLYYEQEEFPLAAGWEAVMDDLGRTYYWHVDTDEVRWVRPAQPNGWRTQQDQRSPTGVAAPVAAALARGELSPPMNAGLDGLPERPTGGVAKLAASFKAKELGIETDHDASQAPQTSESEIAIEGRSRAMSVAAMKRYCDAKAITGA